MTWYNWIYQWQICPETCVNILSSSGLGTSVFLINTAHIFGIKTIMMVPFVGSTVLVIFLLDMYQVCFPFKHLITFTSVYCGFPSWKIHFIIKIWISAIKQEAIYQLQTALFGGNYLRWRSLNASIKGMESSEMNTIC